MLTSTWMCKPAWQLREATTPAEQSVAQSTYRRSSKDETIPPTSGGATPGRARCRPDQGLHPGCRPGSSYVNPVLVKFKWSSELKTEALNIRTSFNILPVVQTTIGRYQCTNRPIPIIGKTADNRPIPIIGRLSVHL